MQYKKLELYKQFNREYKKYSYYLKPKMFAKILFPIVIRQIIKLNYKAISLEFVPDNSFLFNLLMPDDKNILISIYLYDPFSAYSSMFKNKQMVYSGYGKLKWIIEELNNNAQNIL